MPPKNSNNQFSQMQDMFSFWKQPAGQPFDTQKFSQIQQSTIQCLTEANRVLFEGIQGIIRTQSEFLQEQAQTAASIASKSMSARSPEETIDNTARYAQHYFDANVQNIQSVAKSASDTSVKVLDLLNQQAAENLSEISTLNKKAS